MKCKHEKHINPFMKGWGCKFCGAHYINGMWFEAGSIFPYQVYEHSLWIFDNPTIKSRAEALMKRLAPVNAKGSE